MSNDSPTLVEGDIAAKKSPSRSGSPNSNGTAVSRNGTRRKGIRKSNSGGQISSFGDKPRRGTERSKSDSSSTSRPNRKRASKFSNKASLDSSARSAETPSSNDAESVGSYSLENDSIDSKPLSNVRTTVARINKELSEQKVDQKPRTAPKRTGSRSSFGSRSSDKSERPTSPHSVRGSRTNDPLDNQKSRMTRRRSISRSSESGERDSTSPHSVRGNSRSDHDRQTTRISRRRSISGSTEAPKREATSPRQGRTDPLMAIARRKSMSMTSETQPERENLLDSQKSRSAYRRSGSRSSGLSARESEGDSRLENQKRRSAPKRTSSRSSDISAGEINPPPKSDSPSVRGRKKSSRSSDASDRGSSPSLVESPYLRGRKKPSSLRSFTDSVGSPSFQSPLASARSKSKRSLKSDDTPAFSSPPMSVRSKSKKSLLKNQDDNVDDSSHRRERRKTRSKSKSRSGGKLRSSSKSGKRPYRRSRTPSKDEPLDGSEPDDISNRDSSHRRKVRDGTPVSEDEILKVLKSADDPPFTPRNEERRSKRLSKSPKRDPTDRRSLRKSNSDNMRRPRSNSSGNLEARVLRRASAESVKNGEKTPERMVKRTPPRRTRSNNIGVDSSALDSFFQNTSSVTGGRRKKHASSSRSVVSGTKSLQLSGAKSVATTRSVKSRRRTRKDNSGGKPLKSLSADGGTVARSRGDFDDVDYHSFDEEDIFTDSDYGSEDERSADLDLDLATARDNFAQQNLNEKLQLHLTKTDELLYSVFPKHVADALRNGQKVAPENHDLVTIFFSDIVGFTDISAKLDPLKISDMLDRLYNSFDALSDYHDVFKVET